MAKYFFIFLISLLLLVNVGALFVLTGNSVSEESSLEKVKLKISSVSVTSAYAWVAKEKGYYDKEGLDVEFITGIRGSSITAKLVGSGEADIGLSSGETDLIAHSKGVPIVDLAIIFQDSPVCIISLKENGIVYPKDLYGKKLAGDRYGPTYAQYLKLLSLYDLDKNQITNVPMSGATKYNLLFNGKVDAYLMFKTSEVNLEEAGYEFNSICMKDHGVETYGHSIITNKFTLNTREEMIDKFIVATLKGLKYTLENPDEAAEIFVEQNPDHDLNISKKRLKKVLPFYESQLTKKYGLGYQSEDRWNLIQESLIQNGLMSNSINLSNFYTNDFLN